MSEQWVAEGEAPAADQPPHSGLAGVDEALAEIDALTGRPVEEHVEVFERAHQRLRSALDAPSADAP